MTLLLRASLRPLAIPNYRRYYTGQLVSLSGNWMQTVAETWLVLRLTGSAVAVGLAAALQFLPMLIGATWGGLLADRLPKRRLLIATQAAMALPALALFALSASGPVPVAAVYAAILARGAVNAVDNPTRQAFLIEIVGRETLARAVSLNAALVNAARVFGPALAGIVIALSGVTPCFALNALTFAFMIGALLRLDTTRLSPTEPAPRRRGQLRRTLAQVRADPELRIPLALMALVGTLAFNYQVVLPLLARFAFDGGPGAYAALTTAMGAGAVVGALALGARGGPTPSFTARAAAAFGLAMVPVAFAPSLGVALVALMAVGAASVAFAASVNTSLQLASRPRMRGRVMALYATVFLGSTPIGAPLCGWLAAWAGPRSALVMGAVAALAGAWGARRAYRRAGIDPDAPAGSGGARP